MTASDRELLGILDEAIKCNNAIVIDCILGRNGERRALSLSLPLPPATAARLFAMALLRISRTRSRKR